jgi:hypothetical protein
MASEWIEAEGESVTMNSIGNCYDLLRSAVFEAALDQKIAKAIDHKRICLVDNGFDNFELLLGCADFQLLLQKDGSLLVIVTDDFVHNIFPIAGRSFVKKTAIVHWLERRNVGLTASSIHLRLSVNVLPSGERKTH